MRLIAASLVLAALLAPAAAALEAPPPSHAACSPNSKMCSEVLNETVPPLDAAYASTDTVPSGARRASVSITPFIHRELAEFRASWETIVAGYPDLAGTENRFVPRLVTCAILARSKREVLRAFSVRISGTVRTTDPREASLGACLRVIVDTLQTAPPEPGGAHPKQCVTVLLSLPVELKRTGKVTVVRLNGPVERRQMHSELTVSCTARGGGRLIALRPSLAASTLRHVIGGHLSVGYANPTTGELGIRGVFRFS